jgi:hypothetical protein
MRKKEELQPLLEGAGLKCDDSNRHNYDAFELLPMWNEREFPGDK